MSHRLNAIGQCWARHQNNTVPASLSITLSGTGRLLDIKHMCYEYTTPLLPGQLRQPRQVYLIKNIHVARTPPFRTDPTHTCCQGQASGLTVRPDAARCVPVARFLDMLTSQEPTRQTLCWFNALPLPWSHPNPQKTQSDPAKTTHQINCQFQCGDQL